ncbi:MAG TPA: trigger factor [Streptosporangiaceae bacterium]|nr:trigger factor [Streptosporangiaceae bacterium]
MKTDVEELSPTRVRLTVGVPFDELKPSLDHAYREVGRQVRIPGFRPGHVPRQILDQRIGRGTLLEHAINEAVPDLYAKAVRDARLVALGQPEVEITRLDDGAEIEFTAEVDIRPSFELPDIEQLRVTVEDADVSPDQVEEYLRTLRERFASLRSVDRPVEMGDYVSIDLAAQVDGEDVEDAQATGISYEVGSGTILDGLDEALAGMSAEETSTFTSELAGGQHAGSQAEVAVTVRSVKVKDLPELDDDFAQSASEFNTVGELRSGTRRQMEAMRRVGQAGQARDRAVEALLEQVDMPLPDAVVEHELEHRKASLNAELERAGLTMEDYLSGRELSEADVDKELADDVRRSVKAGFILDKFADEEKLGIEQDEIAQYVTQLAYQQGISPDVLARQLTSSGQLASVVSDVMRSKAADLIARRAKVSDQSGRTVEIGREFAGDDSGEEEAADTAGGTAEGEQRGRGSRRGASRRTAGQEDDSAAAKPRGRNRRGAGQEADADQETAAAADPDAEAE